METTDQYKTRVAHLEDDLHNLEAYMEEFTSFLPLAISIVNSDGIIVDTNQAFAHFVGYQNDEATGMRLSDIFKEDERLENLLKSVGQDSGSAQHTKMTLQMKEGDEKTVQVTVGVRKDINNDHTGYFVGISPIFNFQKAPPAPKESPSKQLSVKDSNQPKGSADTSEAAARERRKSQAIIDGIEDGVLVVTEDDIIDAINAHAAEVLSVEPSEICGQPLKALGDDDGMTSLLGKIDADIDESEKMKIGEKTFDVNVRTTEDGQNGYKVVIMRDISRDEFIEDMKLTFVTVAAHQIRTPLASIRWSLEILANQLEDEEKRQVAQRGYRSTQNMLEIVNELLNLDRLQSGQDGYAFEAVDITQLIQDYVDEVEDSGKILKQPEIIFNPPMDPLPKVRGDEEKLKIVVRNIIDNALKYTDPDGSVKIESSVHVTNDYGNDMVQFRVIDQGIGIPDEAQNKVFSKFYRADNATAVKTDGTGIGLYFTKRIVEAHDGTIWFESEEGEGTTFYVQLPIAQKQD